MTQRIARARMAMRNKCAKLPGCDKLRRLPNGPLSVLPMLLTTLAWILGMVAASVCTFVEREVTPKPEVDSQILEALGGVLFQTVGIGFWGWELNEVCLNYEIRNENPDFDTSYMASNAMTAVSNVFGGMTMVCMCLGMCFPIAPDLYKKLGIGSLVSSVFSFSTLCIMGSSVCDPKFFDYVLPENPDGPDLGELLDSSCGLGTGAKLSITAAMMYLFSAIVCFFARFTKAGGRSEHSRRLSQTQPDAAFQNEGFDDEGDAQDQNSEEVQRLYEQRKEETERRYREMFGDEGDMDSNDSDDEEPVVLPFKTMRQASLPRVDERSQEGVSNHSHSRLDSTHEPSSLQGIEEDGNGDDDRSRNSQDQSEARSFYSESERLNPDMQGDEQHSQSQPEHSQDPRGSHDQYDEEASRSYYSDEHTRSYYDDEHSKQSRSYQDEASRGMDKDDESALS